MTSYATSFCGSKCTQKHMSCFTTSFSSMELFFKTKPSWTCFHVPKTYLSVMPRASEEKPQLQCGCYLFQMNELQRKLKEKTKQMMALVAELSMKQALAIKLQQEVRDKEQFLMTVSSRIDQGLPPPKEIENEWLKVLRNEKMQKDAAEARAKVSFCHMLPLALQPHLFPGPACISARAALTVQLLHDMELQPPVEMMV